MKQKQTVRLGLRLQGHHYTVLCQRAAALHLKPSRLAAIIIQLSVPNFITRYPTTATSTPATRTKKQ